MKRFCLRVLLSVLSKGLLIGALLCISTTTWAEPIAATKPATKPPNKADMAIAVYNEAVEQFQQAELQREKGNLKGQEALLKDCIERFEHVLTLDPKRIEAQSNIGFAWLTLKKPAKATQAFNLALAINPKHVNSLNGLATTAVSQNRLDRAAELFQKLTVLDATNAQVWFNWGSVLQKQGKLNEAEKAYSEALSIDPKHIGSLFNLAALYEGQIKQQPEKLEQAKNLYKQVKTIRLDSPVGLEALRRFEHLSQPVPQ